MKEPSSTPSYGDQLRDARKAAGLTQKEAAEMFGVSKTTWITWESGESTPPADNEVVTQEALLDGLAPTFGEKLEAIRKRAKVTQAGLAVRVGVSAATVAYWEKNERLPRREADAISQGRLIQRLRRSVK